MVTKCHSPFFSSLSLYIPSSLYSSVMKSLRINDGLSARQAQADKNQQLWIIPCFISDDLMPSSYNFGSSINSCGLLLRNTFLIKLSNLSLFTIFESINEYFKSANLWKIKFWKKLLPMNNMIKRVIFYFLTINAWVVWRKLWINKLSDSIEFRNIFTL